MNVQSINTNKFRPCVISLHEGCGHRRTKSGKHLLMTREETKTEIIKKIHLIKKAL